MAKLKNNRSILYSEDATEDMVRLITLEFRPGNLARLGNEKKRVKQSRLLKLFI